MIDRYGVYWVNLDPVMGSELAKTRPALVISDAAMNNNLETIVVCPLTSRLHPRWPSRIITTIKGQNSEIAIDQIRTIAKKRIGKKIAQIDEETAAAVRNIITVMYGVLSTK